MLCGVRTKCPDAHNRAFSTGANEKLANVLPPDDGGGDPSLHLGPETGVAALDRVWRVEVLGALQSKGTWCAPGLSAPPRPHSP